MRKIPHVLLPEEDLFMLKDEAERIITHRWAHPHAPPSLMPLLAAGGVEGGNGTAGRPRCVGGSWRASA